MKIAVFGASARCKALIAREINKDIVVTVLFDNDVNKQGSSVQRGYQYIDNRKVYLDLDGVFIDSPQNYNKYEFDYVVVLAGKRNEIKEELLNLGIENKKIILYDRLISSGIINIPALETSTDTFEQILDRAQKAGVSETEYLKYAEQLLEDSKKIFTNQYRIYVLEIVVQAIIKSIKHETIQYGDVKLDYGAFTRNPGLFVYESADILMDICKREMEHIEFIEGPYDYAGVEISNDDVVFDVGANFGLFTAIAASKANNGKVYSFEPVERTRTILKKTAALYDNVTVAPYAVSDMVGQTEIDVSVYDSNQGKASIMQVSRTAQTELINTITLDEFVKKNDISRVDFIKADIEGAERLLIEGARGVLKKYAPKLAICTYHYSEDAALLDFLIKQANPEYVVEHAYGKLFAYVKKV